MKNGLKDTRSLSILGRPAENDLIRQSIDDLKRETISAVSYLYKIAPIIYIDKNGVILNSKDLKEYGYWATLRLGDMLPLDYMPEFGY